MRWMKKRCTVLLAVFVLTAASCVAVSGSDGSRTIRRRAGISESGKVKKRVALVIGNSAYKKARLGNPVNDAVDMGEALKKLEFEVLLKTDVNKREMKESINLFAKKLRNVEIGLFYFAGHGIQVNGDNYLIPIDTDIDSESDVEFEAVHAGRVLGKMEEAGASLNIVILDACRDNPFKRSFRTKKQGLAEMDAPQGTIIAYATSPGRVASDGTGTRNGLYTGCLLKNLARNDLEVYQIFNETGLLVIEKSQGRQVPWTSSTPVPSFYLASGGYVIHRPKPVAEKVEEEYGSITIRSRPGRCRVWVDGEEYGTTPVKISRLASGGHLIRVTRDGYGDYRSRVNLEPGESAEIMAIMEKTGPEKEISNRYGMKFVYIEPGTFWMGQTEEEKHILIEQIGKDGYDEYYSDESPRHKVTLTRGFYMQTTEVTQGQWKAVMGNNPSRFKNCGDDCPVERVSWEDVQEFIKKLNRKTGETYRLPTEAEWEYACRAGTDTALYNGPIKILGKNNAPALDPVAWYGGNSCVDYKGGCDCSDWSDKQYTCSRCGTHPVAQKRPNAWGLYDMHGNVWEWCRDWYDEDYYRNSPSTDPTGPSTGRYRVGRGGSWSNGAGGLRSASRSDGSPGGRGNDLGFRLLREP